MSSRNYQQYSNSADGDMAEMKKCFRSSNEILKSLVMLSEDEIRNLKQGFLAFSSSNNAVYPFLIFRTYMFRMFRMYKHR